VEDDPPPICSVETSSVEMGDIVDKLYLLRSLRYMSDCGGGQTQLPGGFGQSQPHVLYKPQSQLMSRDREDGCATGQPQGVGSEAYLNGTSQGPTPEDAPKDALS
jgi:hypothetical protein